jgi:phosphoribosylamine---glycine ligase
MNVLLIGGGGREHAIAWKLRQSPRLTDLHIAPGNAGTAEVGHNVDLPVPRTGTTGQEREDYLENVTKLAKELKVDLAFVAPDDPLSWGLVDRLAAADIATFGPTGAAAEIESSKVWSGDFMRRHKLPHPRAEDFKDLDAAKDFIRAADYDLVIKADGLAVGKGVIVAESKDHALSVVEQLMKEGTLGDAGRKVVIQERLYGREVSGHAFSDGRTIAPMPLSCDHKAIYDGNVGPNTGGMGVYSPPWWADDELPSEINGRVMQPAIEWLRAEGRPFRGVLYPGLFVTDDGIKIIEFNARFGDPEAQALLPRLKTDLLDIVWAVANGRLRGIDIEWSEEASVCVICASGGYPAEYKTGLPISGLDSIDADVQVFHAGAKRDANGTLLTAGGRVLGVTATAPTLAEARTKVYANIQRIGFDGMHYRTDVGLQTEG